MSDSTKAVKHYWMVVFECKGHLGEDEFSFTWTGVAPTVKEAVDMAIERFRTEAGITLESSQLMVTKAELVSA